MRMAPRSGSPYKIHVIYHRYATINYLSDCSTKSYTKVDTKEAWHQALSFALCDGLQVYRDSSIKFPTLILACECQGGVIHAQPRLRIGSRVGALLSKRHGSTLIPTLSMLRLADSIGTDPYHGRITTACPLLHRRRRSQHLYGSMQLANGLRGIPEVRKIGRRRYRM